MSKKTIFCDECEEECTVSFKGSEEPQFCPFCGSEIDTDWNTTGDEDNP